MTLRLTSPDKELWPGITKADYAAYLGEVAERMLPHVRDRPLSLQRFNAGVEGQGFFVKDAGRNAPDFVRTVDVRRNDGGIVRHAVATTAQALQWLAQINVLTIHVAPVRRDRLDRPDRLVIDFDPSRDDDFPAVRAGAKLAAEILREEGLDPWPMVTGSRGVHVIASLRRTRAGAAVREWAEQLAEEIAARDPKRLTTAFRKAKRDGRVYVDVARNAPSQTAVAPYSPRARPHAPVAMPIAWDRLDDPRLRPDEFTLRDALR